MKYFSFSIIFFALYSVSGAYETEIQLNDLPVPKTIKLEITESQIEELRKIILSGTERDITANVNEFVDKLLENISPFAGKLGLDPLTLPDFDQGFLTARITLKNGTLSGIGEVKRYGDTIISYNTNLRQLKLKLKIEFTDISFKYHFHVVLLLIGPSGWFTGTLNQFRMEIDLGFDFDVYQATLDDISTLNSGFFTIDIESIPLLDQIIEILTNFVTIVLHPVIISIINGIVKAVAQGVVTLVNDVIYGVLHPATTAAVSSVLF